MSESPSRRQERSSRSDRGRHAAESGGGGGGDVPDVVEQLKELKGRAADAIGSLREGADSAADQVKRKATDVTRAITGTLKEEAERLFDEQKSKAASKVTRYGKVVHQAAHALHAVKADGLADVVDTAAEKIEGITDYIEERNLAQVLEDAGEVARSHPGMMIGGMFLTGFALARFLKAGDDGGEESDDDAETEEVSERSGSGGRQGRGASSRGGRR